MAYIGDIFESYNNHLSGVSGYKQNKEIDTETYEAVSVANKNYFLQFTGKTSNIYSGNAEGIDIIFHLKVIYQYFRKNDYADNEKNTWNAIDDLERDWLDYSTSEGHNLVVDEIMLTRISEDYKLADIKGRIGYTRDLKK